MPPCLTPHSIGIPRKKGKKKLEYFSLKIYDFITHIYVT